MPTTFVLTCEHAGNEIPAEYGSLFKGQEDVLYTHQAIDFGALRLAEHLSHALGVALYSHMVSRLLVVANRSLDSDELFSSFSKKLSPQQREQVLENYYFPHRNQVEASVAQEITKGHNVCHFAIHTFTPVLDGEVRQTELGILFDPARPLGKNLAQALKNALATQDPDLVVTYNAPYPGKEDGLPTFLRKNFSKDQYAGFELEINQKFFLNGHADVWQRLVTTLTSALKEVKQKF